MGSRRETAIVTGAAGQDGYYLTARLLAEGVTVHATVRDASRLGGLTDLPNADRLTIHTLDVSDVDASRRLIAELRPDELYNLAGLSSVRRSFDAPTETWHTNAGAVEGLLEAVRTESPETHLYQASSTEMFGSAAGVSTIHDEASPFRPQSPYAASKAAAHLLCDAYRRGFDLRIASGIVSNHESPRRPGAFLTAKVAAHVRQLAEGAADPLRVGNLAVRREWGAARDYVDGMIRICRQVDVRAEVAGGPVEPDVGASYRDYVLGTGAPRAVWELIDRAFAIAGWPVEWDRAAADPADWSASFAGTGALAVVVDPAFVRHADPTTIGTDPSRARDELAWRPRTDLDAFLGEMVGEAATVERS